MTADGAQKFRRFVDLCDTFHLPIVSFVDEPGFMIGSEAERTATIRHGGAALFAVQQSRVPWASVIVRKAYGVAAAAHFGPEGQVYAWPSAESGALPIEGGVATQRRCPPGRSAPRPRRHRPCARSPKRSVPRPAAPRRSRPRRSGWCQRARLPSRS